MNDHQQHPFSSFTQELNSTFNQDDEFFNLFNNTDNDFINPVLLNQDLSPQQAVPSNSRESSPDPYSPGDATIPVLQHNSFPLLDDNNCFDSFIHSNPFEYIKVKEEKILDDDLNIDELT